jgi:peptidoglycan/LPS O-acetylase OafA/YrhL
VNRLKQKGAKMNDQNQNPVPNPNTTPPVYHDWHEQRHAERMTHRAARWQRRGHYGWFGGVILILLGVVFLLQNLGIPYLDNWWALFILIPAFWAYVAAWESYRAKGQLTRGGAGSLAVGFLLTILSLFFLLNLNVNPFWPVVLIVAGIALLGTVWLPE